MDEIRQTVMDSLFATDDMTKQQKQKMMTVKRKKKRIEDRWFPAFKSAEDARQEKKVNFGPGVGVGIGCGVGVGAGLVGGLGYGGWLWNNLRLVMGVGFGCGVGIGYGYGQGFGVAWDRPPPKKDSPPKYFVIEI